MDFKQIEEMLLEKINRILKEEYNVFPSLEYTIVDDIANGRHINSPLPIEVLTDLNALYSIDGLTEITNLMGNVIGQKLALEDCFEVLEVKVSTAYIDPNRPTTPSLMMSAKYKKKNNL